MCENEILNDLQIVTQKVFADMVFTEIVGQPTEQQSSDSQDHLTGMVGLAGAITGVVSVNCSNQTAACVAAKMLFTDISTLGDNDIRDAIGEITNMISGSYKARYVAKNGNDNLVVEHTIPTVIKGSNFETHVLGKSSRYALTFNFDDHKFLVELWLRAE